MSGPLAGLFGALLSEMSARNEYSIFIDDAKRQRILHGLFDNYYADCPAEVISTPTAAGAGGRRRLRGFFPMRK